MLSRLGSSSAKEILEIEYCLKGQRLALELDLIDDVTQPSRIFSRWITDNVHRNPTKYYVDQGYSKDEPTPEAYACAPHQSQCRRKIGRAGSHGPVTTFLYF